MKREHLPNRKTAVLPFLIFMVIALMVLPVAGQPSITLLGRNPTSITVGSVAYFDAGALASDTVDGDLTASIVPTSNVDVTW